PFRLQKYTLYYLTPCLRQFRTETIKACQEMAMEMAMVKGLTEDTIKRLATIKVQLDQRFDTLNQQITDWTMETRSRKLIPTLLVRER
ncbi:MAG TPA: hypothetical protein VEL31_00990, partial [Ktedonobacteraceae bacterium]|nr:hypothetical protein [Ktedonobacteraceae bacterium]